MSIKKVMLSKKIENILLPVILLVISFWDFNRGVDLTDAGYSIAYFINFAEYPGTAIIPTFWSNVLGHIFSFLPYGDTWCGLSFYSTWVIAITVLVAYFFCKKYMNCWLVALTQLLAIAMCWNPNVVLYDYLTFLLFEIGIVLVFAGINNDKGIYLFLAGMILGFNVFVRIPNITECAAIVLVWADCVICKKGWRKCLIQTLQCLTGYLVGVGLSLATIIGIYGIEQLKLAIYQLFSLSNSQENYGIMYMATETLRVIFSYYKYLLELLAVMAIGVICTKIIHNKWVRCIVQLLIIILVIGLFIFWLLGAHLFDLKYNNMNQIVGLLSIFLCWGLICAVINIFHSHEKMTILLALTYIGILFVTPLGSNNNIYLEIMNMFLLFPLGIQQTAKLSDSIGYRIVVTAVGVCIGLNVMIFGWRFVYKDSPDTLVREENPLKGMKINSEKYGELNQLMEFFHRNGFSDRFGIIYCDAPGMETILELRPVMDSPWADWYTFSYDDFWKGIKHAEGYVAQDNAPIIILNELYQSNIANDNPQYLEKDDKYFLLENFIEENNYECVFKSMNYAIYAVE